MTAQQVVQRLDSWLSDDDDDVDDSENDPDASVSGNSGDESDSGGVNRQSQCNFKVQMLGTPIYFTIEAKLLHK